MEGRGTGLTRADKRIVEDLLRQNGGDWGKLKKLADGTPVDKMDMHRVAMYRRELMNRLADESMAEARVLLEAGGESGATLKRKAFGSTNLSSDYDVAIEEGATHVRIGTSLFGSRET